MKFRADDAARYPAHAVLVEQAVPLVVRSLVRALLDEVVRLALGQNAPIVDVGFDAALG